MNSAMKAGVGGEQLPMILNAFNQLRSVSSGATDLKVTILEYRLQRQIPCKL